MRLPLQDWEKANQELDTHHVVKLQEGVATLEAKDPQNTNFFLFS